MVPVVFVIKSTSKGQQFVVFANSLGEKFARLNSRAL